jgi:plastocyanin domain-containing protein
MHKAIVGALIVIALSVGGMSFLLQKGGAGNGATATQGISSNVSTLNGTQVVQITAKGGYAPRVTTASANTPTTINVMTNGTYDCSIALVVPSLGVRKTLPASGTTPIDVPPQAPGTTLKGLCSMGMYHFSVTFI